MEEIKVGDYIRTENGEIHKVEDIEDLRIHIETQKIMFRIWVEDYYGTHKEDRFIAKHSFNLIDLIEVGDYVNGKEIILKDENENCVMYGFKYKDEQKIWHIYEEDILSIVTKEAFASVEYKVKEN